jgi:hypothetical protein
MRAVDALVQKNNASATVVAQEFPRASFRCGRIAPSKNTGVEEFANRLRCIMTGTKRKKPGIAGLFDE